MSAKQFTPRLPRPAINEEEYEFFVDTWEAFTRSAQSVADPPWVHPRPPDRRGSVVVVELFAVEPLAASKAAPREPWLASALITASRAGPPALAPVVVEHLTDPERDVPRQVTHDMRLGTIRDIALAWLRHQPMFVNALRILDPSISSNEKIWADTAAQLSAVKPPGLGRKRRVDSEFLGVAVRAIELAREGRRDVRVQIHRETQYDGDSVADWFKRARGIGYLAPTTRGKSDYREGPAFPPDAWMRRDQLLSGWPFFRAPDDHGITR